VLPTGTCQRAAEARRIASTVSHSGFRSVRSSASDDRLRPGPTAHLSPEHVEGNWEVHSKAGAGRKTGRWGVDAQDSAFEFEVFLELAKVRGLLQKARAGLRSALRGRMVRNLMRPNFSVTAARPARWTI